MLTILVAFSFALPAGDPICVVRDDNGQPSTPHQLFVHDPPSTHPDSVGPALAWDKEFQKAGGNNPTLFVFPADLDGDGVDEIVHVRERIKKNNDVQVRVYDAPLTKGGDVGKPRGTSKKKTVGKTTGDSRIVLMTGGDFDDDGDSEAYVLLEDHEGNQRLEIRKLPKKKNKSMKKVLASDPTFGDPTSRNVLIAAADFDDDSVDEIIAVRLEAGATLRLHVYEPPAEVDGETGPPVATSGPLSDPEGYLIQQIGRVDLDGDEHDELVTLERNPQGTSRIRVLPLPTSIDEPLADPLFVDPSLGEIGQLDSPRTAFGLRGYVPAPFDPPDDLSGTYQASFVHKADGIDEVVPPLGNLFANHGGDQFQLLLPTFNALVGLYAQSEATIDFSGSIAIIDLTGTGITYVLSLSVGAVSEVEGTIRIDGTYAGTKLLPFNQQQVITEGNYSFTRTSG